MVGGVLVPEHQGIPSLKLKKKKKEHFSINNMSN